MKRPVVVAMSVMRMMQAAIHKVIHVVAMRNGGVTTIGTMDVLPVVAFRAKCALVGICGADGNDVFIHMPVVRMMQMAVVKIINMTIVHNGNVPTIFAVNMRMIGVRFAGM